MIADTGYGGFFGWRIVAGAFVLAGFGWGIGFYGPGIYLVALTGRNTQRDLELTRAAGFDLHVLKPPTLKKLEWVLRR